jgi:hypothetical protein
MDKKIYVKLGHTVVYVTEKELELLQYLGKKNLVYYKPEVVEIYGAE